MHSFVVYANAVYAGKPVDQLRRGPRPEPLEDPSADAVELSGSHPRFEVLPHLSQGEADHPADPAQASEVLLGFDGHIGEVLSLVLWGS